MKVNPLASYACNWLNSGMVAEFSHIQNCNFISASEFKYVADSERREIRKASRSGGFVGWADLGIRGIHHEIHEIFGFGYGSDAAVDPSAGFSGAGCGWCWNRRAASLQLRNRNQSQIFHVFHGES